MDTWVTQLPRLLHRGAHSQSMQVKSSSLCGSAPKGNPQSALVQDVGGNIKAKVCKHLRTQSSRTLAVCLPIFN